MLYRAFASVVGRASSATLSFVRMRHGSHTPLGNFTSKRGNKNFYKYAARRSGLRALRAQASRAPCAQANEPRLRPRQRTRRQKVRKVR